MLSSPITRLTTAATDAALALVGTAFSLLFARRGGEDRWRSALWGWVFGLLGLAAGLGTVVHGLALDPSAHWALWQPLHLSIGLLVALLLVAALADWRGKAVGRRSLPPALAVALVLYAATLVARGTFPYFVACQWATMLAVLVVYAGLALGGRPAAGWIATGIGLSVAAGAVQASSLSLTLVWPFDHNGLFHLVELAALLVLGHGLWRSPPSTARSSS